MCRNSILETAGAILEVDMFVRKWVLWGGGIRPCVLVTSLKGNFLEIGLRKLDDGLSRMSGGAPTFQHGGPTSKTLNVSDRSWQIGPRSLQTTQIKISWAMWKTELLYGITKIAEDARNPTHRKQNESTKRLESF